ncbi:MAG: hypothetical protein ACI9PY_000988 [Ascidiaceihabitans sp.]|jgi:hypothetical protein
MASFWINMLFVELKNGRHPNTYWTAANGQLLAASSWRASN